MLVLCLRSDPSRDVADAYNWYEAREPGLPPIQFIGTHRSAPSPSASMSHLFRLPNSARRDPAIDTWLRQHTAELGEIAEYWFEAMRKSGDDVRECLHDGHPTAWVADAAFGYVNVSLDPHSHL